MFVIQTLSRDHFRLHFECDDDDGDDDDDDDDDDGDEDGGGAVDVDHNDDENNEIGDFDYDLFHIYTGCIFLPSSLISVVSHVLHGLNFKCF